MSDDARTVVLDKERAFKLRQSRGWSQAMAAKSAGVSEDTIGRIEIEKAVRLDTVNAIAEAYGVQVSDLLSTKPPLPRRPEEAEGTQRSPVDLAGSARQLIRQPTNNPYTEDSASYVVPTELNGLTNLALLLRARAQTSSTIPGWPFHKTAHLNDGLYGNLRSWIAAEMPAWAEIDLGADYVISMVAFGSEARAFHCDRAAKDFSISVSCNSTPETRIPVYVSRSDSPVRDRREFHFAPRLARFVRIDVISSVDGPVRIDEIEVYGTMELIS